MKTFSLAEVAAQVLPSDWTDAERWLRRRLNRGEIRGYRVSRRWRMTEAQVAELVDKFTNAETMTPPAPIGAPLSVADGLSSRSRRRLRRTA